MLNKYLEDQIEIFQRGLGEINISKQKYLYLFINILEQLKITKLHGYRVKFEYENVSKSKTNLETLKINPFPFHINIKLHFKFNSMKIYSKYTCGTLESPGSQGVKGPYINDVGQNQEICRTSSVETYPPPPPRRAAFHLITPFLPNSHLHTSDHIQKYGNSLHN